MHRNMSWRAATAIRFLLWAGSVPLMSAPALAQTEVFEFAGPAADCCTSVGPAADNDGDGLMDVFVTGSRGTTVHSGFDGSVLIASDARSPVVSIGDVNGDGFADLYGGGYAPTVYGDGYGDG